MMEGATPMAGSAARKMAAKNWAMRAVGKNAMTLNEVGSATVVWWARMRQMVGAMAQGGATTPSWATISWVGAACGSTVETMTGEGRSTSAATSFTPAGMVAEKRRVWRVAGAGMWREILRISGRKPMSRRRSHSSSTKLCMWRRLSWKPRVFSMWSRRRPGVATRMPQPPARRRASAFMLVPPMTTTVDTPCGPPITSASRRICSASSRVGEMTRTPMPPAEAARRVLSRCTTGMRKAMVLPVPVRACAIMSLPSSASGSAAAWMAVADV
mmetsp:Transcript_7300/g.29265  ORF Transcript_7300/g.29265 Transcript_7300/m.29265 type:complete len:271 (-) Transcript_7300:97-909(-)